MGKRSAGAEGPSLGLTVELAPPAAPVGEEKAKVDALGFVTLADEVLRSIDVDLIEVNDQALRYCSEDDDIVELAESIAARGLLQPVGVSALPGGRYQLLWGGRRLAAHRRLRARAILARVYRSHGEPVKSVALVENLQRRQLTLQEECDAVHHLHFVEEKSPEQIAGLLSVSRSWVMRRLALPGLPVELRDAVFDGRLGVGAAERIALLEDAGARAVVAQEAINRKCTFSEVEAMVDVYQHTPSIPEAVERGAAAAESAVHPAAVYLECAACARPRLPGDLVVIRVCADGCQSAREERGKVEQ